MNSGVRTYAVTIFNERYTLATDQCEQQIKEAVTIVDTAMHDIAKQLCITDAKKIAVLVALRLTEEILTMRSDHACAEKALTMLSSQIEQVIRQI